MQITERRICRLFVKIPKAPRKAIKRPRSIKE
jgi:hypothetical protein